MAKKSGSPARQEISPAPYLALLFLSGAAGLGYQAIWMKMFSAGIGHEVPATLAVVGAFMAGLACGSFVTGQLISRIKNGTSVYGAIEIIIGLWGLGTIWLMPHINQSLRAWIGLDASFTAHWTKVFFTTWVALLPATAAMGATLVLLERVVSGSSSRTSIGLLYAANTAGAMVGALASAFVLMPHFGLKGATIALAIMNFIAGPAALWLGRGSIQSAPNRTPGKLGMILITLFLTGLLGIGYELLGIRMLSQTLENTVYTFATVLAVYLFGTSIGAAIQHRFRFSLDLLIISTAVATLLCGIAITSVNSIYHSLRQSFGSGAGGVFLAELIPSSIVFLLPTMAMGALFTKLAARAMAQQISLGSILAVNTLGSALAPILIGTIIFPWLGSRWTLIVLGCAYLLLQPKLSGVRVMGSLIAIVCACAVPVRIASIDLPEGNSIIEYKEGMMASVAVLELPDTHRVLKVNNHFQMGGTGAAVAEQRHADIPLLLHGHPQSALFLGLGTGITLATVTNYAALTADGVELSPEVLEVMPAFFKQSPAPSEFPQIKLHVADARRFTQVAQRKYDVIVGDLFHPAQDGAGFLYTKEHFASIHERLSEGGLFCQWLPLYQLDDAALRTIMATFLQVFPHAQAWLLRFNVDTPVLGLIGRERREKIPPDLVENQARALALGEHLKKVAINDTVRLLGCYLGAEKELREYTKNSPINTDQFPRVIFEAPYFIYKKNSTTYGRLFTLLEHFKSDAADLLPADFPLLKATRDFIAARNVYLRGLQLEEERKILEAVEKYIESARLSSEFTLGYAQCLTIASALWKENPAAARKVLEGLVEVRPERPIARQMLERLSR